LSFGLAKNQAGFARSGRVINFIAPRLKKGYESKRGGSIITRGGAKFVLGQEQPGKTHRERSDDTFNSQ